MMLHTWVIPRYKLRVILFGISYYFTYTFLFSLPRRMGPLMVWWFIGRWKVSIEYYRLPVPHISTSTDVLHLWAHWVWVWCLMLHTRLISSYKLRVSPPPFLSPFSTHGYKQKPTITPLISYLRSQYTLFAKISLFHPSYNPTLLLFQTTIVDRYKTTDPIR